MNKFGMILKSKEENCIKKTAFKVIHNTSESCFSKYIFKYTNKRHVFIIIGKFQSFFERKT